MKNLFLAAGVAALALAAPASADRGGKGNDKRPQASKAERGGGGGQRARAERRADRGRDARVERRSERKAERSQRQRTERRSEARAERSRDRKAERRSEARAERARDRRVERVREARNERQAERRQQRVREARNERQAERRVQRVREARNERQAERRVQRVREARNERQAERRAERVREARADRIRDRREAFRDNVRERRVAERYRDRRDDLRDRREVLARLNDRDRDYDYDRFDRRFASRGLTAAYLDGCPPGLAKQNELCMPPGQYKKLVGQRLPSRYSDRAMPLGLRDYYRDTDDYYYRYGDGYAYRVDRDDQLIRSVLPLLGAGLGLGMQFPYSSPNYYVPSYYQSFYPDSPYSYYRYADGYVYEIDRYSGTIEDVIPLLDQGYGVGQMLPASYSYYNLPDPYRSWYQDDDDYYYRYAPGGIYQVDRDTQLITALVSLLTGGGNGLSVGQPLPMGYDMYNVPYAYRDRYYDTPDSWYRYSNGNIYQVDPTTRLITAVVDAIV